LLPTALSSNRTKTKFYGIIKGQIFICPRLDNMPSYPGQDINRSSIPKTAGSASEYAEKVFALIKGEPLSKTVSTETEAEEEA
tara:strand:- start:42 stop:290 length:249 start_codon:yes stop_codon:yes gene_type:complete